MNYNSLMQVKKDMQRFLPVLEKVVRYFNLPQYVLLVVLIQNAAFDGSNTVGYSIPNDINKLMEIKDIIKSLKEYSGQPGYIESWVCDELEFSILGSIMTEDIE